MSIFDDREDDGLDFETSYLTEKKAAIQTKGKNSIPASKRASSSSAPKKAKSKGKFPWDKSDNSKPPAPVKAGTKIPKGKKK